MVDPEALVQQRLDALAHLVHIVARLREHVRGKGGEAGGDRPHVQIVHLVLADLRDSALDGKQAEDRLHEIGITVNRNAVPFDPRPPAVSSGLRVGTPALATRGFGLEEFVEVGRIMGQALAGEWSDSVRDELAERTRALAEKHPLYPQLLQPTAV